MTGRTRGRKPVNYRVLDGDDSDDDFSTATPPTKRPCAQRGAEREAEFADGAGPSGARLSRDDKLFKKQLRIALEISKGERQSASESSQEHSVASADTVPVSQEDLPPDLSRTVTSSQQSGSQDSAGGEDEWTAGSGAGSSSEENGGDDSDFSEEEFKVKKKKPAAKSAKAKPVSKKISSKTRSPAAVNQSSRAVSKSSTKKSWASPPQLSPVTEHVPAQTGADPPPVLQPADTVVKSPPPHRPRATAAKAPAAPVPRPALKAVNTAPPRATPANLTSESRAIHKWKPPARIGSGTPEQKILSPSGGSLRLGLSRNRKFKPLHPTARPV